MRLSLSFRLSFRSATFVSLSHFRFRFAFVLSFRRATFVSLSFFAWFRFAFVSNESNEIGARFRFVRMGTKAKRNEVNIPNAYFLEAFSVRL
jgi:hypothetical protein